MRNTSKKKIYTANVNAKTNLKSNKQKDEVKGEMYQKDSQHVEKKIIQKYMQKGFESLSIEELAVTLISPTFAKEFSRISGTEWPAQNKSKAIERLNYAKFNIQWNASMNKKSPTQMLKSPFGVLFTLVERGDVQKVTEFFRQNSQYMNEIINTVDNNKKSLLHIAAKTGNVNMISFLISKKFSVYFRDKFLRTPLHLACQFGRERAVEELIKANSQILAKDSIGRTCLHYAACSDSTNLVTFILGKEPDLITARDTYGRTPLHYAVWNGTSEQVNIVKKLLEAKAEVDALDEEGMTALHFAAEAGKGKIIPLLLKYQANPFIKDGRSGRTAIELACNDRIREMIIVYCSKEYQPELDKLKLRGVKFVIQDDVNIENGAKRKDKSKSKSKSKKKNKDDSEDSMDDTIGGLLNKSYQKKLLELLRAVQAYGVKTMQHVTRPELYSGSWLEKINNASDFFDYVNNLSPSEASLSIFNVLHPYSDKLPKCLGEEPNLANFFDLNSNKNNLSNGRRLSNRGGQYMVSDVRGGGVDDEEIEKLKEEIKKLNQKIEETRQEVETAETTKLKTEIERYQAENEILKQQSNNLNNQILTLNQNVKDFQIKCEQLQKLSNSQKDKIIKVLNNKICDLNIEMNRIRNDSNNNYNIPGVKNFAMNPKLLNTQCMFVSLTLDDERDIYVFLNLCNKTGKDLYNILLDYDRDNDFHLLKQEFISVLDFVQLPFEQRDSIIKVSGFDCNMKLPINQIASCFLNRQENKIIKLNQCLFDVVYKLQMTKKTVEDVYKDLLSNANNKLINIDNFRKVFDKFMIRSEHTEEIINDWEYNNGDGVINIEDLTDQLKKRETIVNDVIDINDEIKFGVTNYEDEFDENNNNYDNNFENYNDYTNNNYANNENQFHSKMSKTFNGYGSNNNITGNNFNNTNNNFGQTVISLNNNNYNPYNSINNNFTKSNINSSQNNIDNNYTTNKQYETNNNLTYSKSSKSDIYKTGENFNNINKSNHIQGSIVNNTSSIFDNNNINNSDNIRSRDFNGSIGKTNNNINENTNKASDIYQEEDNEYNDFDKDINEPENTNSITDNFNSSLKDKKQKKSHPLNPNEQINGELKVQVKNIENVMIPRTISLPCPFFLTCSIEGFESELKSKEVETDDMRNINFNWSTRVVLAKTTLKDLSAFCNLNLSVIKNNATVTLGNAQFNWTKCVEKNNWDKFVINDYYKIINQRKIPMGNIKITAKFIPFGSKNSYYEKNGKRKKQPTNLNGIAEVNNSTSNSLKNKSRETNKMSIDSKENNESNEKNENNENRETITKEFDVEITNVADKEILELKNYYLAVYAIEDGKEQEKYKTENTLTDILGKLPFTFNFTVYSYTDEKEVKIVLKLMKNNDEVVGSLPIIFSNKEKYAVVNDRYNINTEDDNEKYMFFLKFTVNTVENE